MVRYAKMNRVCLLGLGQLRLLRLILLWLGVCCDLEKRLENDFH